MKKFKALQTKRHIILNKNIIGIDPGKHKHQAAVLNAHGMLQGQPFTFKHHYWGLHKILWKKLTKLLTFCNTENTVFAIESLCNLCQKLVSGVPNTVG